MKNTLFIVLFIFLISTLHVSAQGMTINETTIIKDENGKKVAYKDFIKIMNSGDYIINQRNDSSGSSYIQLMKATKEQKEQIKKMMMSQMSGEDLVGQKAPPFEMVDTKGNKITSENTKGKVVVLNF